MHPAPIVASCWYGKCGILLYVWYMLIRKMFDLNSFISLGQVGDGAQGRMRRKHASDMFALTWWQHHWCSAALSNKSSILVMIDSYCTFTAYWHMQWISYLWICISLSWLEELGSSVYELTTFWEDHTFVFEYLNWLDRQQLDIFLVTYCTFPSAFCILYQEAISAPCLYSEPSQTLQ